MRTKTLLLSAAAMAAGLLSSMAQSNVYSANVVGYVNLPLTEGFNLVANQLDLDLSGTNNTIVNVFSNNLPVNSQIYSWNGSTFDISSFAKNKAGTATNWTLNFTINPGQGFWLSIPTGAFGGGTSNVTVVGNVLQGTLVNTHLPPAGGYSLVSSEVPISGGITTNLNYKPMLNDQVYVWNGSAYNIFSYAKNKAGTATNWTPSEPALNVGQGFWLNSGAGATWTNVFIVQ
ncbi:MAG TPA: hypothetical protein VN761_04395 [Candidatus Polarisedimenticolia bacterium]|nr:hypothetical protein [Candidatus Polarisedimenticolia bacterium]